MLYDVYKIGMALLGDEEEDNLLEPETPKNLTHVISICFEIDNESFLYSGIKVNDYTIEIAKDYLLRKAGANGSNYGPTAQLTEVDKTLNKKIISWFKDAQLEEIDESYTKQLENIYNYLVENNDSIQEKIKEEMPKGKGIKNLITVKINNKYPRHIAYIYEIYANKLRKKLVGSNNKVGTCCLCGKNNVELLPKVDVFKFYTLDKPGFISGGFNEDDIWRNCPVCISCEPILRKGKQFMLDNLKFDFCGLSYYLFPSSTTNIETNSFLLSKINDISDKSFSFQKEKINETNALSEDIFYELAEDSDINSYRMLFLRKDNSAERIILDMKDIFPSRFKKLYLAKAKIEKSYKSILEDIYGEKNIYFNFYYFREFLRKTDSKRSSNDLDNEFLSLTRAIFLEQEISNKFLIPHYMRNIRNIFKEEGTNNKFRNTVMHSFIGLNYLKEIGCIFWREESFMNEKLQEFFKQYELGLDTDIKKSLVLIGALIEKVKNIQYKKLNGSTPFDNKLKGLKMNQSDISEIFIEIRNKFIEYKDYYSNASKILVEEVTKLMFQSPSSWKMLTGEINFYVVGGMALSKQIYESLKEEKNDDSE